MKRSAALKRSPLARRSALARTGLLAARPRVRVASEAERLWKAPVAGFCECGCGRYAEHLERHHVVERQRIKRERRFDLEWDLRNSMLLDPFCHARHTGASQRLRLVRIPTAAWEFAREFLGEEAEDYLARRYR